MQDALADSGYEENPDLLAPNLPKKTRIANELWLELMSQMKKAPPEFLPGASDPGFAYYYTGRHVPRQEMHILRLPNSQNKVAYAYDHENDRHCIFNGEYALMRQEHDKLTVAIADERFDLLGGTSAQTLEQAKAIANMLWSQLMSVVRKLPDQFPHE